MSSMKNIISMITILVFLLGCSSRKDFYKKIENKGMTKEEYDKYMKTRGVNYN